MMDHAPGACGTRVSTAGSSCRYGRCAILKIRLLETEAQSKAYDVLSRGSTATIALQRISRVMEVY